MITRFLRCVVGASVWTRLSLVLLIVGIVLFQGVAACSPGAGPPAPLDYPLDCDATPGLVVDPPVPVTPLQADDEPVVKADSVVGTLPGAGSVAPDGSYRYDLPFAIPAGIAGVQPSLSLAFSSRGTN